MVIDRARCTYICVCVCLCLMGELCQAGAVSLVQYIALCIARKFSRHGCVEPRFSNHFS